MKLIFILFLVIILNKAQATVTVLDSFTEGPFTISNTGSPSAATPITSPFGETRRASLSPRQVSAGGRVTSSLDGSSGAMMFNVDASPSRSGIIDLRMNYSGGGPYSLRGFSAFEFNFSSIMGSGTLLVSLDYGEAVYPSRLFRVPLNSPGTTVFDVSDVTLGSRAELEDFDAIQIIFEARTEQFSFTLDEIRIVPEPSAALLSLVFLFSNLLRRRRDR